MAVPSDADGAGVTAAEASKERILKCAPLWYWYEVLGVKRSGTLDDIKTTYRKLCLLHHPDKAGGDPVTFKTIHKAYQEGVRISMVRASKQMLGGTKAKVNAAKVTKKVKVKVITKPDGARVKIKKIVKVRVPAPEVVIPPPPEVKAHTGESERVRKELTENLFAASEASAAQKSRVKKQKAKPVPPNASKAKLQAAIAKWDSDSFKGKTMPDEVQTLAAEEAAAWLKEGSCIPVDVRSEKGSGLPGAVSFTYFQFLTTPEELASDVHRLREDGKRLLIFSQDGADMGPCGLVGSLLLDIFGFEDEAVFRLRGGFEALRPLLDSSAEDGLTVEAALSARKALSAAKIVQKEADAAFARAKADLVIYDAASREHLDVLAKGTWATEDTARDHLAQLSPLLTPLKIESSLLAMLTNAASKRPPQRGPFDSMVFTELGKRFAEKITGLQQEVAAAATQVSGNTAAVKAAQAQVDEHKKVCSPKKKRIASEAATPTKATEEDVEMATEADVSMAADEGKEEDKQEEEADDAD